MYCFTGNIELSKTLHSHYCVPADTVHSYEAIMGRLVSGVQLYIHI